MAEEDASSFALAPDSNTDAMSPLEPIKGLQMNKKTSN